MPDSEKILATPPAEARKKQLCEVVHCFWSRAAPPALESPGVAPPEPIVPAQPLCGAGGSRGSGAGPLSLQWAQAMSSPPRSVFSRGLFAQVTEPGSRQAPGTAARCAAPLKETLCLFTVAGLTCWWPPPLQKEAHRASHPLWASKAFYPPLTIRNWGLPKLLAELVPVGWLCVAARLGGGSISSQLNIGVSGFPLAQWLCK